MQIHLPHCGTAVRRFCNTCLIFVEIEAKTEIENFTRSYCEATFAYSMSGRPLLLWVCFIYYIILYYVMLRYVMLCYVMLCYVMLCYIILYHIISYHVMSYIISYCYIKLVVLLNVTGHAVNK